MGHSRWRGFTKSQRNHGWGSISYLGIGDRRSELIGLKRIYILAFNFFSYELFHVFNHVLSSNFSALIFYSKLPFLFIFVSHFLLLPSISHTSSISWSNVLYSRPSRFGLVAKSLLAPHHLCHGLADRVCSCLDVRTSMPLALHLFLKLTKQVQTIPIYLNWVNSL